MTNKEIINQIQSLIDVGYNPTKGWKRFKKSDLLNELEKAQAFVSISTTTTTTTEELPMPVSISVFTSTTNTEETTMTNSAAKLVTAMVAVIGCLFIDLPKASLAFGAAKVKEEFKPCLDVLDYLIEWKLSLQAKANRFSVVETVMAVATTENIQAQFSDVVAVPTAIAKAFNSNSSVIKAKATVETIASTVTEVVTVNATIVATPVFEALATVAKKAMPTLIKIMVVVTYATRYWVKAQMGDSRQFDAMVKMLLA